DAERKQCEIATYIEEHSPHEAAVRCCCPWIGSNSTRRLRARDSSRVKNCALAIVLRARYRHRRRRGVQDLHGFDAFERLRCTLTEAPINLDASHADACLRYLQERNRFHANTSQRQRDL